MYIQDMQEKIVDTWRISPEVVKENEGIVNFKVMQEHRKKAQVEDSWTSTSAHFEDI
jgi:hypothetical protein